MAVPQVVDPDGLEPARGAPPPHLVAQVVFCEGEDPLPAPLLRDGCEEIGELVREELRHGHVPPRLRRLWGRDDVPPLDPLVALGDVDEAPLEVDIVGFEREELADPQAAPVQDLERVEGGGLVHDLLAEHEILFLRPELHLRALSLADLDRRRGGAPSQAVVFDGVVEDGAQLVVYGSQVGAAVRLPLVVVRPQHLVLPVHHIFGGDVAHSLGSEEWHYLRAYDVLFGEPGVELESGPHVCGVPLHERLEGHRHRPVGRGQELRLPRQSLVSGREPALHLVPAVSVDVAEIALDVPRTCFLIHVGGHQSASCLGAPSAQWKRS